MRKIEIVVAMSAWVSKDL